MVCSGNMHKNCAAAISGQLVRRSDPKRRQCRSKGLLATVSRERPRWEAARACYKMNALDHRTSRRMS